jgi:hypothetical protein
MDGTCAAERLMPFTQIRVGGSENGKQTFYSFTDWHTVLEYSSGCENVHRRVKFAGIVILKNFKITSRDVTITIPKHGADLKAARHT